MDLPPTQMGPFGGLPTLLPGWGQRLSVLRDAGYQTPGSDGGHTPGKS